MRSLSRLFSAHLLAAMFLISAVAPGSPQSAAYSWTDLSAPSDALYAHWLEVLNLDGRSTFNASHRRYLIAANSSTAGCAGSHCALPAQGWALAALAAPAPAQLGLVLRPPPVSVDAVVMAAAFHFVRRFQQFSHDNLTKIGTGVILSINYCLTMVDIEANS